MEWDETFAKGQHVEANCQWKKTTSQFSREYLTKKFGSVFFLFLAISARNDKKKFLPRLNQYTKLQLFRNPQFNFVK